MCTCHTLLASHMDHCRFLLLIVHLITLCWPQHSGWTRKSPQHASYVCVLNCFLFMLITVWYVHVMWTLADLVVVAQLSLHVTIADGLCRTPICRTRHCCQNWSGQCSPHHACMVCPVCSAVCIFDWSLQVLAAPDDSTLCSCEMVMRINGVTTF